MFHFDTYFYLQKFIGSLKFRNIIKLKIKKFKIINCLLRNDVVIFISSSLCNFKYIKRCGYYNILFNTR